MEDASGRSPTATPPARSKRRWFSIRWRYLAALVGGYLACMGVLMLLEESLIFFPSPYPEGDWEPHGLDLEDAWFTSPEGLRLHGWYAGREDPRAVVLFCHGNAGNVTHRAETLRTLSEFVGAATEKREPYTSGVSERATLAAILAGYESIRTARPVTM